MANEKYNLTYSDRFGNTWLLEIHEVGVSNTPVTIVGGDKPLTLSYREATDIFEPVMIREAKVEIISETDLQYSAFFRAEPGQWLLKVYRNATLYWEGQNTTESYQEPYTVNPYKSVLTFSDLADLDFIYYLNSGSFYSGFRSLAQVVSDCVGKLQIDQDIREMINVVTEECYTDAAITDKSTLANTYVDSRAFIKYDKEQELALSCLEVLRRVCGSMKCRMFQYGGKWHIFRVEEGLRATALMSPAFDIDTTTLVVSSVSPAAYKKTIDNTPLTGITPIDQDQELSMSELFNIINHKFVAQEVIRDRDDLIFNYNFDKGVQTRNNTTFFPLHFNESSDISSLQCCQVVLDSPGQSPSWLPDTKKSLHFQNSPNHPYVHHPGFKNAQNETNLLKSNWGKYYLKATSTLQDEVLKNVAVTQGDSLKIVIDGKLTKETSPVTLYALGAPLETQANLLFEFGVYVKAVFPSRTYYLHKWPKDFKGKWQKSESVCLEHIKTPSWEKDHILAKAYLTDEFTIEINTDVFPVNETATSIEVRLYLPRIFTNISNHTLYSVNLKDFSIKYITDGDFSYDISGTYSTTNISGAKENAYDSTVYLGDGLNNYTLNTFRIHTNKTRTTNWRKLDVSGYKSAAEIFNLVPISKLLTNHQRVINGSYLGEFEIYHCLEIDDGVSTRRYMILADEYDTKSGVHNLVMQELDERTVVTTTSTNRIGKGYSAEVFRKNMNVTTTSLSFVSTSTGKAISTPASAPVIVNINLNYPG